LFAAVTAWLSMGTLALASAGGPRIALLPLTVSAVGVAVLVAVLVVLAARRGAPLTPLWLLVLVVLGWLPIPVPPAFLMWSGPLCLLIWGAVAALLLLDVAAAWREPIARTAVVEIFRNRPVVAAGMLAFAIFALSAWRVSPSIPGGDEPHYLVITQSLLRDHDLRIENNHRRGDYQAYFPGTLRPDFLKRGRDGEIYSIHAPGVSALVAPAFALGGYRGVVIFLLVLSAAASALAWQLARIVSRSDAAAWFGWTAVTISATSVFHSFAIYPDGPGGALVLTGVWALLRADDERRSGATGVRPWFLHGLALAALPWLHSRFAGLAAALGALILLRLGQTKSPAGKAVAFLTVPAVSAIGWVGYFVQIYGTPDPAAPYGGSQLGSLGNIPLGLAGLLFDQRFGLLANAPVLLWGLVGLLVMLIPARFIGTAERDDGRGWPRLALELLFVASPYLMTVTHFTMWWGGWSAPARLATPVVPLLVIPCAVAWRGVGSRATRVTAIGSLGLTAFVTAGLVLVDGGHLAYNTRQAFALFLEWASGLADLRLGLPDWFQVHQPRFYLEVAAWIVALAGAWWLLRSVDGAVSLRARLRFVTVAALVYAAAAMAATSVVWAMRSVSGLATASAQMTYLRRLALEPRVLALELTPPHALNRLEAPGRLRIDSGPLLPGRLTGRVGDGPATQADGRRDRPLLTLPAVPAGRYRIRPRATAGGGLLMIAIADDQFAIRTEPLSSPPVPIDVDFPVEVRALVIRGDEEAARSLRGITVEPVSLLPGAYRLTTTYARRAVRYRTTCAFFLDEGSYPEPDAFWIRGGERSSIVLQRDDPAAPVRVQLRNAPVDNQVTLESGPWREQLSLAPGEERELLIPMPTGAAAGLVTIAADGGFRPSEVVPGSLDQRFLGVWVRIE
jgi:hypothetical protein